MRNPEPSSSRDDFDTTCWSVVLAAKRRDEPRALAALEQLCRTYWYPLYAYVRRSGHSAEDSHDLTQGFFLSVVSDGFLDTVSPEKGKFRAYLLACCRNYLRDQRRRERAGKRDGGRPLESIDQDEVERRYREEPWHDLTPERLFERRWALAVLDQALHRLDREMDEKGRNSLFVRLRGSLTGEESAESYARIAADLSLSAGSIKVQAHRLRRRYGAILREEIGRTVAEPEQIDEEIRDLFQALALGESGFAS